MKANRINPKRTWTRMRTRTGTNAPSQSPSRVFSFQGETDGWLQVMSNLTKPTIEKEERLSANRFCTISKSPRPRILINNGFPPLYSQQQNPFEERIESASHGPAEEFGNRITGTATASSWCHGGGIGANEIEVRVDYSRTQSSSNFRWTGRRKARWGSWEWR